MLQRKQCLKKLKRNRLLRHADLNPASRKQFACLAKKALFHRDILDTDIMAEGETKMGMGSGVAENTVANVRKEVEMKASQQAMAKARIPLEYRDYCAHLLIPLNKCRGETFYLPWKCENERHAYEKCQYEEWVVFLFCFIPWTRTAELSLPDHSYKRRMREAQKAREEE